MKTIVYGLIQVVAGCALLVACSSSTQQTSDTASISSQLFTLEPTPARSTLQKTATGYLATVLADPATEEFTWIRINPAIISNETQTLAITLPNGKTAAFKLRDFNTLAAGVQGWVGYKPSSWKQARARSSPGEIDNDPMYFLSIAREGNSLVGNLVVEGQRYRIESVGAGQYALVKVDESKLPPEGEPLTDPEGSGLAKTTSTQPASTHSTIRVLIVSTNQSRARYPDYRLRVAQALQDANQYLINSRVAITYELAGFYDANYNETSDSNGQLTDLRSDQTELGKAVYVQRDALNADLVTMLSTFSEVCGRAYLNANKALGYSVFSCIGGTLAHELGHNLGVHHGWNPGDPVRNPPYMHGYRDTTAPAFHTIMVTSHGAVPYFSNPARLYQERPMGTTEHHDAARRFNERRETVESFYPPLPILSTVVTVYDNVDMSGEHCTFEVPSTQAVVLIENVCPRGWKHKIWSARVQGINPKTNLRLGNEMAWHMYHSDFYAGDFDIPTLTRARLELPDGMTMEPQNGNLTKRVDRVTILR